MHSIKTEMSKSTDIYEINCAILPFEITNGMLK